MSQKDIQKKIALGKGLSIEQVVGVARFGWRVSPIGKENSSSQAEEAYDRVVASRKWVEEAVRKNEEMFNKGGNPTAYYGINTGFGSKAGRKGLPEKDIAWVSRNLLVSHSTGVGDPLHLEIVRAAMLIRANSLAQGYSGVRVEVINTLVEMLNNGIIPVIPEYGSVGASGDLASLSHLGLVFSKRPSGGETIETDYGEGGRAYLALKPDEFNAYTDVFEVGGIKYVEMGGHEAMKKRGIELLELGPKEGLAFNNGATFSAAIAALALYDAENVVRHAEIATALSLEALLGFRDAFLPKVQEIRRHTGQIECAQRILKITEGSNLLDGDIDKKPQMVPPQDPYSLRVSPQVIGAVWDTLNFVRRIIEEELNAATDNPFIFLDNRDLREDREYKCVSGGNFHGAPIAYVMDFLSIVITDLGSLSERRTFRLTDDKLSFGLPSCLIEDDLNTPGLISGLMIAQYLAAGLVSDCKTLAHPDSVDSIPTCGNQEDHVSMSMNAARHARKITENIGYVIAVEILSAHLGLCWRKEELKKMLDENNYSENEKDKKRYKSKVPWGKRDVDRNRQEEAVTRLHESKEGPTCGTGSLLALETIEQTLSSLPPLGNKPTKEDRFLQPYVIRVSNLLRSEDLVREVYKAVNLDLPLSAIFDK